MGPQMLINSHLSEEVSITIVFVGVDLANNLFALHG